MHATCSSHTFRINLISLIQFGEEQKYEATKNRPNLYNNFSKSQVTLYAHYFFMNL
jgi:hypothetical protein